MAFARDFFGPSGKKRLILLFWPILGHFWCSLVTFLSNLNIFEKNPYKNPKNPKKFKNPKISKKISNPYKKPKNPKKIFKKSHPVSESRVGGLSVMAEDKGRKSSCLILDALVTKSGHKLTLKQLVPLYLKYAC